jgi:hypothetical protein
MIQLYQDINIMRVLSYFFHDPYSGFYLREIARELDMSPMTVKRAIEKLENNNILVRFHEKNLTLFKINMEYLPAKYLKITYNISELLDSGLINEIKEKDNRVYSIILYGSLSKGTDGPESDIDILVISPSKKKIILDDPDIEGRNVSIMQMTPTKWKEQSIENRAFYFEIFMDGIPLFGDIPVMQ